jgi:DNA-binding YbaB/EbfC family protein
MANRHGPDSDRLDFGLIAERASQLHRQLQQVQGDLKRLEGRGFGANGLVQATLSGQNELVALVIDPSVIDPDDPETLSELVREAVNEALASLAAQHGKRVSSVTDGLAGMLSGAQARPPGITPVRPLYPLTPPPD